jgi:hypothetical protein
MEGVQLEQRADTTYLGIIMTASGVDMAGGVQKRMKGAQNVMYFLKKGRGNRAIASCRVYPIFIRSILEYGYALRPLTQEELAAPTKLQNSALCSISTVPRTTSTASLHLLTNIIPVKSRNLMLNANLLYRLHCSTDARNLATLTYRDALGRRYRQGSTSTLRTSFARNSLWRDRRFSRPMLPILRNTPPNANDTGTLSFSMTIFDFMGSLDPVFCSRCNAAPPLIIQPKLFGFSSSLFLSKKMYKTILLSLITLYFYIHFRWLVFKHFRWCSNKIRSIAPFLVVLGFIPQFNL